MFLWNYVRCYLLLKDRYTTWVLIIELQYGTIVNMKRIIHCFILTMPRIFYLMFTLINLVLIPSHIFLFEQRCFILYAFAALLHLFLLLRLTVVWALLYIWFGTLYLWIIAAYCYIRYIVVYQFSRWRLYLLRFLRAIIERRRRYSAPLRLSNL